MAWRASSVVDQRRKFVEQYESGQWSMAELCRIYEISRESGYKWLKRSQQEGEAGLADRSRAAHLHPNQIDKGVEQQIVALRHQHPSWGPRKLQFVLQKKQAKDQMAGDEHDRGPAEAGRFSRSEKTSP